MSDTYTLDQQPDDYQVTVSFLSTEAQQIVHDGLAAGENPDDLLLQAQDANTREQTIGEDRHEQAVALAEGDFAKADDLAQAAGYEMHLVADDGAANSAEIIQSDHDQLNLSVATGEAEVAHDNAVTADSYAATGDADHAAQYAAVADTHADVAVASAGAADAGGTYATHEGTDASETSAS